MNTPNPTQESRLQEPVTVHVKLADFLARLAPEKKFDISISAGCTVAEFIENEKTLIMLKEYGIDYGQGYYLGCPETNIYTKCIALASQQQ